MCDRVDITGGVDGQCVPHTHTHTHTHREKSRTCEQGTQGVRRLAMEPMSHAGIGAPYHQWSMCTCVFVCLCVCVCVCVYVSQVPDARPLDLNILQLDHKMRGNSIPLPRTALK